MLTPLQAQTVLKGCIRTITGQSVLVDQTLRDAGIGDATRIATLRSLIVMSPTVGVPRFGHTISPQRVALTASMTVNAAASVVQQSAQSAL
jgi:hypothetical protein